MSLPLSAYLGRGPLEPKIRSEADPLSGQRSSPSSVLLVRLAGWVSDTLQGERGGDPGRPRQTKPWRPTKSPHSIHESCVGSSQACEWWQPEAGEAMPASPGAPEVLKDFPGSRRATLSRNSDWGDCPFSVLGLLGSQSPPCFGLPEASKSPGSPIAKTPSIAQGPRFSRMGSILFGASVS